MRAALTFLEVRHHPVVLVFGLFLGIFIIVLIPGLVIQVTPAGLEDFLTRGFIAILTHLGHNGRCVEFTIGVKCSNKADGNQVINTFLLGCHCYSSGIDIGGDDSMMVGHLAVVKHFLAFGQLVERQYGGCEVGIRRHRLHDARHLRVDVITQVGRIHTRICRSLLLIERLDGAQGIIGRHAKLLVAFHLQTRQIKQAGRRFASFFGFDGSNSQGQLLDFLDNFIGIALGLKATLGAVKGHAAVLGLEFPIVLGHKIVNLALACDNHGKCRCLHTAHREHIA